MSVRFIAIFKAPTIGNTSWSRIRRVVDKEKMISDVVTLVAYEESGQRWGFVERSTQDRGYEHLEPRGWVKLPSPILDEEWPADPRRP